MPRKKSQSSGNKPLPANQQKCVKACAYYHDEKIKQTYVILTLLT